MAIIKEEEIKGIYEDRAVNPVLKCRDCFGTDFSDVTLDDILTEHNIDDDEKRYFCDVCKKLIV